MSMCDAQQPFLIVTSSDALCLWEAEFSRVARLVDVLIYNGGRDNRRIIRTLEFYHEGGGIMFQVLLSTLEAVVEVYYITRNISFLVLDCFTIGTKF